MLTVVGGTYREVCYEPDWDQLFGSGLRAAIAASTLIADTTECPVKLITWESPKRQAELRVRAESFGLSIDINNRGDEIDFWYEHGLSGPIISPAIDSLIRVSPRRLDDLERVLMFGLLEDRLPRSSENNITLNAKTAVYDPQSEDRSIPWSDTGSRAERLAIVSNFNERERWLAIWGFRILELAETLAN